MSRYRRVASLTALLLLAACATFPTGPSVMSLPGTGRSFDQFRADDADCRQFAAGQTGGPSPNESAVDSGLRSAAVGTAVGAVAGAAMGGQQGAAVGAGTGLIVGSVAGAGASQSSAYTVQRRYDNAYVQCMYAKGHRVPVSGQLASQPRIPAPSGRAGAAPVPSPGNPPPPPSSAAPGQPVQAAAGTWYYCDAAKGYYPYVARCPSGWRAVPTVPPLAPR